MPEGAAHLQCMEVWGGNHVVDTGVVMAGLDAWVYSRPYGGAAGGGDVHYVSSCATGRITRLLLADVAGHGGKVADLALELRGLMRRYVNYLDQGRFVRELNGRLGAWSDTGRFATAIVTTFFAPTNYLTISNAGHPAPMLYRAKTKAWCVLDARTLCAGGDDGCDAPLGVIEGEQFHEYGVRLGVGDLVLCYTDSLIESRRGDGRLIGVDGLLEIVRHVEAADPATLVARLIEAVAGEHAENLTEDDVTVLLFRPNGTYPRIPLREKALTGVRLARGLVGSLLPRGEAMPWPELSVVNIGGSLFHPLNRLWGRRRPGA